MDDVKQLVENISTYDEIIKYLHNLHIGATIEYARYPNDDSLIKTISSMILLLLKSKCAFDNIDLDTIFTSVSLIHARGMTAINRVILAIEMLSDHFEIKQHI